jgi:hypothetical protein
MSNQWVECPNRKHSMMKNNVICPICLYETTSLIGKCLFKPRTENITMLDYFDLEELF